MAKGSIENTIRAPKHFFLFFASRAVNRKTEVAEEKAEPYYKLFSTRYLGQTLVSHGIFKDQAFFDFVTAVQDAECSDRVYIRASYPDGPCLFLSTV
jgi:hypothetical protein